MSNYEDRWDILKKVLQKHPRHATITFGSLLDLMNEADDKYIKNCNKIQEEFGKMWGKES